MLPVWIQNLPLDNFQEGFKNAIIQAENPIQEIDALFGRLNAKTAMELLPDEFRATYPQHLSDQEKRVKKILEVCVTKNSKKPFNPYLYTDFYKDLSAYAGEEISDCVHDEITQYLFSLPLPISEAKALGYYSIEWLNTQLSEYEKELIKTIEHLVEKKLNNSQSALTLREQQLLCKHAVLVGNNKIMSWMHLLTFCKPIESPLYNLLKKPSQGSNQGASFHKRVIEETLKLFFDHSQSILPGLPNLRSRLEHIFGYSEILRQTAMYFIDYLQRAYHENSQFAFSEALKRLDNLIEDRQSEMYSLLISLLYYCKACHRLRFDRESGPQILEAILTFTPEECHQYKQPIQEKFLREGFVLNQEAFSKIKIPKKDWAAIILRRASLETTSKYMDEQCPYLNFKEHLIFIENVEKFIGFAIPISCKSDLLFFQTLTSKAASLLEDVIELRETLENEYLDHLTLPFKLYNQLQEASNEVLDLDVPKDLQDNLERASNYSHQLALLSIFLKLVAYPKPFFSINELMPIGIDAKHNLIYHQPQNLNKRKPFIEDYPEGPQWEGDWKYNTSQECYELHVIIYKSSINFAKFKVPLKIPDEADELFFQLLERFVSLLGKEVLSEEEELEIENLGKKGYILDDEIVHHVGTPEERFDKHVSGSPLLKASWENYTAQRDADPNLIKKEIYTFISTLQITFKKTFYRLFTPK